MTCCSVPNPTNEFIAGFRKLSDMDLISARAKCLGAYCYDAFNANARAVVSKHAKKEIVDPAPCESASLPTLVARQSGRGSHLHAGEVIIFFRIFRLTHVSRSEPIGDCIRVGRGKG